MPIKLKKTKDILHIDVVSINLLHYHLHARKQEEPIANFEFNVRFETGGSAINKLVLSGINIDLLDGGKKDVLAQLSISCIYKVKHFDELSKIISPDSGQLNADLAKLIHLQTHSTARGILYSQLKGTYLHNAILPTIEL
jgi:hypothetical protein